MARPSSVGVAVREQFRPTMLGALGTELVQLLPVLGAERKVVEPGSLSIVSAGDVRRGFEHDVDTAVVVPRTSLRPLGI